MKSERLYLARMLRELRIQSGFTRYEVCGNVGVHYQTLAKWEQGTVVPSSANLVKALRFCGADEQTIVRLHRLTDKLVEVKREHRG